MEIRDRHRAFSYARGDWLIPPEAVTHTVFPV